MSDEQLKYEQIERYLSGALTAQESADFEQAMSADRALAKEVALHRTLKQSLGNPARRKLLDALADVSESEMSVVHRAPLMQVTTRRWVAAAASVLVLFAVGLWWFLRRPDAPPAFVEKPLPQPSVSPAPIDTTSTPDSPVAPAPRQYLAANFTPNPALDPLVGEQMRGVGAAIKVEQPRADANFIRQNERVDFHLKGRTDKSTAALTLRVFNNRERDFIAGKNIVQAEISTPDGVIDWNNKWKLAPGRYYVVLYAAGEEEPGAVLRFFVEKPGPSK